MRRKKKSSEEARERLLEEVRKMRAARSERTRPEDTYRAKALEILPWVCAKCGRDFTGKDLRDLTVHHKDHDHRNNPADGSNWELLCVWCHDDEHDRKQVAEHYGRGKKERAREPETYRPFEGLAGLLGSSDDDSSE